jgi:hypothetical protein
LVNVFREKDSGGEVSEEGKLTDHITMPMLDLDVPNALEGHNWRVPRGRRSRESSKTMLTEVRADCWAGAKMVVFLHEEEQSTNSYVLQ